MDESELFRFEVPTARGKAVVIMPDDLTEDEAAEFRRRLVAILAAMFAEHEPPAALKDDAHSA